MNQDIYRAVMRKIDEVNYITAQLRTALQLEYDLISRGAIEPQDTMAHISEATESAKARIDEIREACRVALSYRKDKEK